MEVKRDVLEKIAAGTSDGLVFKLPKGKMDRASYLQVNKVLEMLGGRWDRKAQGHVFEDDAGERIRDAKLQRDFRLMVHESGGSFEDLPDGSFSLSGTNVRTCLVLLKAPGDAGRDR